MDTETINLSMPPEPFMKSSRAFSFLDDNFVWIAIVLSMAAHFGTLAILQRDNVVVPRIEEKKIVAKVRIFANPGGNPNSSAKAVEVAKPKPQVKPKPRPDRKVISTAKVDDKPAVETPPVENSGPQSFGDDTTGGVVGEGFSTTDGESDAGITSNWEPATRVDPVVPVEAREKGIEGYVLLSLDIDEEGKPENLSVVKAEPRNLFEKEARAAVRKWRYKPRMVNGQAVKVLGHQVRVEFKISG
ncbi:MAG: energy transducer TonB [Proteobacteria bacterium]|nr:MAG: energy transducer TonB [Pseudomonadota bacterium]